MMRWFAAFLVSLWLACAAHAQLALDGTSVSGQFSSGTTVVSPTFTTTNATDVIVAAVYTENTTAASTITTTSITATGLTFSGSARGSVTGGAFDNLSYWWAPTTSTFSGAVTAHLSGTPDDAIIIVFAVSGANTSSPWDSNASLPASTHATTNVAPSVSGITTSNANDMLLAFSGMPNQVVTQTAGAMGGTTGTLINTVMSSGANTEGAEERVVSATQSSISVAFVGSASGAKGWSIIADAIVASGAGPTCPVGQLGLLGVGC